jgi:ubiquinone/menaquinone biosynthesis C-methylase UbiE
VLSQRARGSEFLDRPDSDPKLTERSFRFIRFVNRDGGGIRVVRRFLETELRRAPATDTVRLLDLGCGDCDIPLAVARWADARGHRLEFTCIDHNAEAIALARGRLAKSNSRNIKIEQADILSYQPANPFDYAIGSMFFHHFTEDEIVAIVARLRRFVRRAVLINDLHRCTLNYLVCSILTLPADRELRHDALLSIRRGFKPRELTRLLSKHDPAPVVRTAWFCRVAGVVRFDRKETP